MKTIKTLGLLFVAATIAIAASAQPTTTLKQTAKTSTSKTAKKESKPGAAKTKSATKAKPESKMAKGSSGKK